MLKKDAYKIPGVHEGFEARGTDFQTEDQGRFHGGDIRLHLIGKIWTWGGDLGSLSAFWAETIT